MESKIVPVPMLLCRVLGLGELERSLSISSCALESICVCMFASYSCACHVLRAVKEVYCAVAAGTYMYDARR
jgi:hypothetical protein